MSSPIANSLYPVANGITSSNPFIELFLPRPPTASDVNYPIQKRWYDTAHNVEYLLESFTSFGGILQANWVSASPGLTLLSFTGGTNTVGTFPVVPTAMGAVTLSSSDGTVTITGSANALDFKSSGGAGAMIALTGNTGPTQTGNSFMLLGAGSITIDGASLTMTVQLTTLTNHNILLGQGTSTIGFIPPSATAGIPLISQGVGADPNYGTAVVAGGGTGSTSFNPNGVVISGSSGTLPLSSLTLTNGQVVIGSTDASPVAGVIIGTGGINVLNAAGSITISGSGGSFSWTDVTGSTQALVAQNGYITDHAAGVIYTLPASALIGDTVKIMGKLGIATITPNANQQILIGTTSGSVGVSGTAVAQTASDSIELICITAGASSVWRASTIIGTWVLS